MNSPDNGRGVFTSNDLRRLFDALTIARPDLSEALGIVRVALGLERTARTAPFEHIVDAEWKVRR